MALCGFGATIRQTKALTNASVPRLPMIPCPRRIHELSNEFSSPMPTTPPVCAPHLPTSARGPRRCRSAGISRPGHFRAGQYDRHGPVVDGFDDHVAPEDSLAHSGDPELAQLVTKQLAETAPLGCRGGAGKGGAMPPPTVSEEGELADHQRLAPNLEQ